MRRVSSRLAGEGMKQQSALHRRAWSHQLGNSLEVETRLLLGPRRISRRKRRKPQSRRQSGMTIVAAHAILTLLKEDWLDARAVGLVVERLRLQWTRLPRSAGCRPVCRLRRNDEHARNQQHQGFVVHIR